VPALDLVASWDAPDARAAVVARGGRGVVEATGDTAQPGDWASVTKLVTALAVLVAVEEEMPFADYLSEGVLQPLGMTATRLEGSPAAGLSGPLDDLVRLAEELLSPTLIAAATFREATTVAFPGLDGVLPGFGTQQPLDWGLGFEIRDGKSPHWTGSRNSPATFGHFGAQGSFLWVDPEAGLACAVLSGRDFESWAKEAWPALSDAVLDEHGP
jgi:CubicO group peptidase (beta-lactamase class C family)